MTTADTKAPLPSDIENIVRCLETSWPTSGGKLRAHIAAQAKKIAKLEYDLSEYKDLHAEFNDCLIQELKKVGLGDIPDQFLQISVYQAVDIISRYAALEASNKRLREIELAMAKTMFHLGEAVKCALEPANKGNALAQEVEHE